MTFNSLQYAAFLSLVLAGYWRLRRRGQNLLLLVASYVFYGAFDWRFLGLLAASTVLDFWFGARLEREGQQRKRWLVASLVVNLGILATFKYFGFFVDSAERFLGGLGLEPNLPLLKVVLPVGISFYTFHGISYVFDVYRRRVPATRSLLDYAVFVAFFPQLVAGPIGRAELQLPQFGRDRTRPTGDDLTGALLLVFTGLFKKVAIADAVAPFVNETFANPSGASAVSIVGAAIAFSIQIYGDFSGYTDIARGSARLLGIELPINFRQPYLSRSITEFWRRWHISLSNWLRDYLYIPLGGNRGTPMATYRNLLITMLLGGLWHGAAWTFVVWGGAHGLALSVERRSGRHREDHQRPLVWSNLPAIVRTGAIVCALFVVFRAASLSEVSELIAGVVTLRGGEVNLSALVLVGAAGLAMLVLDLAQRRRHDDVPALVDLPAARVGVVCGAMVVAIIVFSGGTPTPFIYFQF